MWNHYLCVDGWNSHHLHIENTSMVVHPLHPWERNLKCNETRVNLDIYYLQEKYHFLNIFL